MPYANKEHEEFHEKLKQTLYTLYGKNEVEELNDLTMYMWRGSSVVHITASTYGKEDKPMAEIWCKVTVGTPLTDALAKYLIVENSKLNFGAFSFYPYDDDPSKGNVVFELNFPGFALSEEYLEHMIGMVSWTGDEYDDQIAQRFGGRTMEQVVSSNTEPTDKSEDEVWE